MCQEILTKPDMVPALVKLMYPVRDSKGIFTIQEQP